MSMAKVVAKFVLLLFTIMLTKLKSYHIFSQCCKEGPLFFIFSGTFLLICIKMFSPECI